jgi:hypothetical protein
MSVTRGCRNRKMYTSSVPTAVRMVICRLCAIKLLTQTGSSKTSSFWNICKFLFHFTNRSDKLIQILLRQATLLDQMSQQWFDGPVKYPVNEISDDFAQGKIL